MMRYWQPGDQVVSREIWLGRIWSGRPCTVVEDSPRQAGCIRGVRWPLDGACGFRRHCSHTV